MNKTDILIDMFLNKSNEYFRNHKKDLEYSLNYSDKDYVSFVDTDKLFDKLITCYCANLTEDIKWMSEEDDDYYEYAESIAS